MNSAYFRQKMWRVWLLVIFLLATIICQHKSKGTGSTSGLTLTFPECDPPIGSNVTVSCWDSQTCRIESIEWIVFIRGRRHNISSDPYVTEVFMDATGVLTFNLNVEHNMTAVACRATYENSNEMPAALSRTLYIHGVLPNVTSLTYREQGSNVFLTWMEPYTPENLCRRLNDISYCVNVVNSTSSATLHSECEINVTEFTYPLPPKSWCHQFAFTVTPVNLVGNGSQSVIHSRAPLAPTLVSVPIPTADVEIEQVLNMSAPVCSAEVTFTDVDSGENVQLTNLTFIYSGITFIQRLTENRYFNVSITASNIAGRATSYSRISTHDIESSEIVPSESGFRLSTTYFNHSRGMGALYCFMFITDKSVDFTRSVYLPLNVNTSYSYPLPINQGKYRVLVYGIEEDGTLLSGVNYPAITTTAVSNNNQYQEPDFSMPSNIKTCEVTQQLQLITVECEFLTNSSATAFQMVVQPRNLSDVHKLYANKTTDGQTSASVQVEEDGVYQVTVFAINERTGIINASLVEYTKDVTVNDGGIANDPTEFPDWAIILLSVTGFIILVLIVALIIIIVFCLCRKGG